MKVLLVAATVSEIQPLINAFAENDNGELIIGKYRLKILITGVGMVSTAFAMGEHLACHSYDFAINAGIAGSMDPKIDLGETCLIVKDTLSELGAEDDTDFISIENLGLGDSSFHHQAPANFPTHGLLPVDAITVNTIHGNEQSIKVVKLRLHTQLESMEGAAFFYACSRKGLPCIQIRTVSNYVERRNRNNWNIPLAVKNLNEKLINLLET